MKNILYIEMCNFKDYPLGGHLSFAIHLTTAMEGEIDLAGTRTDELYPERKWTEYKYNGFVYKFYNIKNIKKISRNHLFQDELLHFLK